MLTGVSPSLLLSSRLLPSNDFLSLLLSCFFFSFSSILSPAHTMAIFPSLFAPFLHNRQHRDRSLPNLHRLCVQCVTAVLLQRLLLLLLLLLNCISISRLLLLLWLMKRVCASRNACFSLIKFKRVLFSLFLVNRERGKAKKTSPSLYVCVSLFPSHRLCVCYVSANVQSFHSLISQTLESLLHVYCMYISCFSLSSSFLPSISLSLSHSALSSSHGRSSCVFVCVRKKGSRTCNF